MQSSAIQSPLLAVHSSIMQVKAQEAKAHFEMLLEGMDSAQIECCARKMCVLWFEAQEAYAYVSVLLGGVESVCVVCCAGKTSADYCCKISAGFYSAGMFQAPCFLSD